MPPSTAQEVQAMRFISYAGPLECARRWSQSKEPSQRREARILLEELFARYPHSLEIAQQLSLAYLEEDQRERAQRVLDQIAVLQRTPHEEVLSRTGRIYRDQGDRHVRYPEIGGERESPPEALHYYRLALDTYHKAYQIRFGHYPGINVATLHFLIGALTADEADRNLHLRQSREIAQRLLDGRATCLMIGRTIRSGIGRPRATHACCSSSGATRRPAFGPLDCIPNRSPSTATSCASRRYASPTATAEWGDSTSVPSRIWTKCSRFLKPAPPQILSRTTPSCPIHPTQSRKPRRIDHLPFP